MNQNKPKARKLKKRLAQPLVKQIVAESAAGKRRKARKRNKGATSQPRPGKKIIMPIIDNRLMRAQAVRANILVDVVADITAVLATGVGIMGVALNRGYELVNPLIPIFWAYVAFINDLKNIMLAGVPLTASRLEYVNEILVSYAPKSVPFKGVGEISYSWENADTIVPANSLTVRTFTTYFYEDTGIGTGSWSITQIAPAAPDEFESLQTLAKVYNILADRNVIGQRYEQKIDLGTMFKKDVSGFASVLAYFGAGAGAANGPSQSCENEVPFMSILLAVMSAFSPVGTRVSRFLKYGAGDTCCAFAMGALPKFEVEWFKTCYAPIYKFIDIQEITVTLVGWMLALAKQANNAWPTGPADELAFALTTFPFTARQFAIMVRQCVLALFADTQALSQLLKPSVTINGFEALRMGTNCYAKSLPKNIEVPNVLRENLVNLVYTIYTIKDRFQNKKNVQVVIPVLGTFITSADYNPMLTVWDGVAWTTAPFFLPPDPLDPNIIDCTNPAGTVIDVNDSNILQDMITEWNERILALRLFSIPTSYLGGSSGNGHLLWYTRLNQFLPVDFTGVSTRKALHYQKVMQNVDLIKKKKIERSLTKTSKDKKIEEEIEFLPAGTGIAEARTIAVSSVAAITETFKSALPYIILPFAPIEPATPPTQTQWRTASLEASLLTVVNGSTSGANTRLTEIVVQSAAFGPGIAASAVDEFANVITEMNGEGKGGFFGDLIGGVLATGAKMLGGAIPI